MWRTNCTKLCAIVDAGSFQYCQQNQIASVEASRANWCLGSETPAFSRDTDALHTPGQHNLTWDFSTIASGGEWLVSPIHYAYGD